MITFIILTRNNPEYLQKCLGHLEAQTVKDWNAIVIDTSDEYNNELNEEQCTFVGRQVEHWPYCDDRGFAVKNNMGIKKALENKNCGFVCLLNDDAYINTNFVKDVIMFAGCCDHNIIAFSPLYIYENQKNKIQVMGGGMFSEDAPCGEKQLYHDVNIDRVDPKILQTSREIDFGYGAAIVYRREVFEQIGFLDEHLRHGFDEPDFAKRMKKQNLRIFYVPTTVHHVCGGSSIKRSFWQNLPTTLYMNRGYLYFLLKHYPAKFVIKKELGRIKKMLFHPRALLIEFYSILWNIYEALETRMEYHELYDEFDKIIYDAGGIKKEKLELKKVSRSEKWCDRLVSYSFAICLLIVPCILYLTEMIL